MSAFLDAYLERCVKPAGLRSINAICSRVAVLKHHIGHLPLSALDEPDEVNRFKTDSEYAEDVELATMHRVLETVRAAINWGMAQTPPLFTKSPFHRFGVRLNKKAETARDRRLSRDEEKRLLDAALNRMNAPEHQFVGPILHDRIIGALELCCRRGEMLLIQNKRVNWDTCQVGIPARPQRTRRTVGFRSTRTDAWPRFSNAARSLAVTHTCSAVRMEPISRTSRLPGRPFDYSRTESNRSQERKEDGTRSTCGESTSAGTICVTKAPVGCWSMAWTSESFN